MRKFSLFLALALMLSMAVLSVGAQSDPFIQLVATDITLDETEFTYTGQEIRPNVTVRVNGQLLTLDRDYFLDYADNIEVGEAKVIVTGIATAGYAGTAEHPFFIREAEEPEIPEESQPETSAPTEPEVTEPETTEPTQPETSEPTVPETSEPTVPETTEPAKPAYRITKGDKSSWTQGSSAALSFTADGPFVDFEGVSVDGRKLEASQFDAKDGTVVLLKNAFLKTLNTGSHTITVHFAGADASGSFTVAAADENPKTGDIFPVWLALLATTGSALLMLKKQA